jgi:hypothetical protein
LVVSENNPVLQNKEHQIKESGKGKVRYKHQIPNYISGKGVPKETELMDPPHGCISLVIICSCVASAPPRIHLGVGMEKKGKKKAHGM